MTKAAALASASSAAPSVATIVSVAFGSDSDLESFELSPPDWEKAVRAVSEEVNDTIDRLYGELQLEQQGLAYVSHLAQDTVHIVHAKDDAARERRVNGLWAALWGSELGQRNKLCQRALDQLLHLAEQERPAHAGFLGKVEKLSKGVLKLMLDEEGRAVYTKGIASLNSQFNSTLSSHPAAGGTGNGKQQALQDTAAEVQLPRSLLVSASSEQAAFLQDLHTVQGAGNVIQGGIYNVRKRLIRLLGAVEDHEELTFEAAKQLRGIMGRLDVVET